MAHIFVERQFDPTLTTGDVIAMAMKAGGCFGLYRIGWVESLLSMDGHKLFCHFQAPDTESVRVAFRQTGGNASVVWPGTVHVLPDRPPGNVLVERRFDLPVTLKEIQAIEDAGAWCLETRHVTFERTFFSLDHRRMICLYRAPDAESVRQAQRQAGMPVERVWAFQKIGPGDLAAP